ncbi:MAG TPA: transglycosylase SLT domain-containing protein [Candidatus Dormibacteraeota bacterium]
MTRARVLTLATSLVLLFALAVAGAVVRQVNSGGELPQGKTPRHIALDAVPAADSISVAEVADHSTALAARTDARRAAQEAAEAAAAAAAAQKAAEEAAAQKAAQEAAAQKAAQEAAAQKAAQEAAAQRAAQEAAARAAAQQAAAQRAAASGSIPAIITAAFSPLGSGAVTWALRVAKCESGYNPNAVNASSGAAGLFQFMRSTWAGTPYAGSSIFDPVANARAAAWLYVHGGPGNWSCK